MSDPNTPANPEQNSAPEQPAPPQYLAPQAPEQPPAASPQQPQYAAPAAPQQPQYAAPAAPVGAPPVLPPPGPGEPFDGTTNVEDLSRPFYGVSFGNAVKRFFKNYANFSGRASRSEFWFAQLFLFIVGFIPGLLLMIGAGGALVAIAGADSQSAVATTAGGGTLVLAIIGGILYLVFALATIVPTIAISWRRLHDANLSGLFWLLNLASIIPFLNYIGWIASIAFLVLTILPSKPEGRRYASTR